VNIPPPAPIALATPRLELRGDGTVIGMCGLVRRDTLPIPDLGLTAVLAITTTHNQRSMAALRALGMALEDSRALTAGAPPVNVFRLRLTPDAAAPGAAPATDPSMG
jgi:hypothetical protein